MSFSGNGHKVTHAVWKVAKQNLPSKHHTKENDEMMTEQRLEELEAETHPLRFEHNELVIEVRRLREALKTIADHELAEDAGQAKDDGHHMRLIARETLDGTDGEYAAMPQKARLS